MQPGDEMVDEHGHVYESTLVDRVWDHEAGDYEPLTEVEQALTCHPLCAAWGRRSHVLHEGE